MKLNEHYKDEQEVYDVSDFFKIFSDSTRLKILSCLIDNELTVTQICEEVNLNKSAVSHQLMILKANKLVKYRKEGKNVIYSLDDEHVSIIINTAKQHLREK